jgi:hypothetical protein
VLKEAMWGKKLNSKTGRQAIHYTCASCKHEYPAKEVNVDHVLPVVDPIEGFKDWDTFIKRLFCSKENLQVLCSACHTKKSKEETNTRTVSKSNRVLYPREESSYRNMMSRCYNSNATGYEYYGGKGVKVCEEWKQSFNNFYQDMGIRPENTSLDRIDVNGDYSKENCRWASPIEQARNTTYNNYIDFDGKTLCIEEWANIVNMKANTILYRLRRGWPVEEALGYKERVKKVYNGRLSVEDLEDLVKCISSGESQVSYGKRIGMDASQVNRLYNKFKTKEEREVRSGSKK